MPTIDKGSFPEAFVRSTDCRFLLLPVLLLAACAPGPESGGIPEVGSYDWRNPHQGSLSEQWMKWFEGGARAGHLHIVRSRSGDEIRTRTTRIRRVLVDDEVLEARTEEIHRESVDGEPLGFRSTESIGGGTPTITEGTFADGLVTIVTEVAGNRQERTEAISGDARMSWGWERRTREEGLAPGTEYSGEFYPPIRVDAALPVENEVREWKTIGYSNAPVDAIAIDSRFAMGPEEIAVRRWMTGEFTLLYQTVEVMGTRMRMVLVDKDQAENTPWDPEIAYSTRITPEGTLPEGATRALYRIRIREGPGRMLSFPSSAVQTTERDDDAVLVTVGDPNSAGNAPLDESERARALSSDLHVTSDHQAVRDLLSRTELPESVPERARALHRIVHDHVENQELSVATIDPAHVVAERGRGDCSEHAMLLAALGRADGIPSRIVVGLRYLPASGERPRSMIYHMWTQFHIDGEWIDFDATEPEADRGPGLLALHHTYPDTNPVARIGLEFLNLLDALEIGIESTE